MKKELEKTFHKPINKLFFIGIGGSSMSGLAGMALDQGLSVEGSDMVESSYTGKLKERDVIIHIGHNYQNIPEDTDLVVYSAAINDDNPDMVRATDLGLPKVERSDYLGLLSHVFPKTIGVAGTHGKTTTSSMMAALLHYDGRDPSVSIGGKLDEIGGNACLGHSDYLVIESCEYVDSFLKTKHYLGIITNIEEDHLDYFKGGLSQIKESFHQFGAILPEDGLMVAYGDSQDVLDAVADLCCPVVTYGLSENNDCVAKNITYNEQGNPSFDATHHGTFIGHFSLKIPGEHNVLNAMSCIAAAHFLDIEKDVLTRTLKNFGGAKRRFEFRGEVEGSNVYEDYAHHPTELKVVVQACLNHAHKRLWVIFQPHTYSRTYYLFDDFVDAFEGADKIILNDIYSDREDNDWDIYSEDLAKIIKLKHQTPTIVMTDFEDIVKYLTDNLESGDLVLVAGSQTINKVAYLLVDALKEKYHQGQ
ncbi:UDP-N-acetylmuramate--L-alanine ligase [Eubacterium aggregans]|uniref:UDP-N-acetylmuramate--L-alanine ligase n=1 Tax=Eubacterium aggregans TaxID=81409 RepID=UPI003F2CEF4F